MFCVIFEIFGHQFDVFAMFLRYFIYFWTVVRTVCGQFRGIIGGFLRSCWANLARALSVPGRSFVLGARNCTEGLSC